jgi:hypothetical protein
MQALEDLIVQTEIFLQYSLQAKAVDRLQKIAEMFPGEEETNARLKNLVPNRKLVAEGRSAEKSGSAAGRRRRSGGAQPPGGKDRRVQRRHASRSFQNF